MAIQSREEGGGEVLRNSGLQGGGMLLRKASGRGP